MSEAAIPAESLVPDDAGETLALARRIAALAQERRATEPVLLDVRALVDYTDFFLLVSGQSSRQNLAIAEHVVKTLKGEKRYALSKSGLDSGSWVCLDLGSVVVHVFDPETRARYDLELLWADAPRIDVDAPLEPTAAAATPDAEPAPKRRRRAVRKAAVADADAANAPDSARPPLDEPEPVAPGATPVDVDEPAPKRRKASKSADDKPEASAPAPKKSRAKSAKPAKPVAPAPDAPTPARKNPSTRAPRKRSDSAE